VTFRIDLAPALPGWDAGAHVATFPPATGPFVDDPFFVVFWF